MRGPLPSIVRMTLPQDSRLAPLPTLQERVLATALVDRAAREPQHRVLEFPTYGVCWTLQDLLRDAQQFAGGLRGLGLQPGERLGIMLTNRPEYVLAWWGSLLAGTIDVSINHEMRGALLVHQLKVASVKAILCDRSALASLESILADVPDLRIAVLVESSPASCGRLRVVSLDRLLAGERVEATPAAPAQIVSIRYTSGTTGPAKAVGMTNSEIAVMAAHFAWLTELSHADRLYTCFPLHHGIASILGVVPTVLFGGCCIVDERFSARSYWKQIAAHRATLAHVINPLVPILLAQPPSDLDRQHACRRLWTAYRVPEFEERFATRTIMIYGSSEGGVMAYTAKGDVERPASCGKPSPLFEMQIVDDNGLPLPAGQEGELVWRPRAPHLIFAGYFGDPVATVNATRDLWFHPGDLARFDADGYLHLIGRMGDQIRRKGVNIPAESIELVARGCPGVIEAAAIAVPSQLGESEVKLCILCDARRPSIDELMRYLCSNLPRSMVPRFIEFRSDLPRTDTHKVAKRLLREEGIAGITPTTIDVEEMRACST